MRRPYEPMLFDWPKIQQYTESGRPEGMSDDEYGEWMARKLDECIYLHGRNYISAFIATPIGCGTEYGLMPPASYWKTIRQICDDNNILLIADEVVTGFGRTGKWFCMEHFDVEADLMILGKGITSLSIPMGAVVVNDMVNEPFAQGTVFNHGFISQGHGVACAASLAAVDILESDDLVDCALDFFPDQTVRFRKKFH